MTDNGKNILTDLFNEYYEDIAITKFNLEEKTLLIPTLKAKWIQQYAVYNHELDILQKDMDTLRNNQSLLERNKLKVSVTTEELSKMKFKNSKDIEDLAEKIHDYVSILETLGELKKVISFLGNDVRNILDYIKLETL